jgi:hypothetical protein
VIPLCRLSWLFANILVVGGEKSHCIVYEHLLIFYALLRDFYYALGDYSRIAREYAGRAN